MPFVFVYSPSDFVGGLPDEQGAAAAGRGPFTLTLSSDAKPTIIEISDDDGVFDEVDGGQTLASSVNIDGASYSGGTSINTAYDLINTTSGHQVTSFHFGGNGYQQGAVDGIVSTVKLEAGQSYTFNRERTSHRVNNEYDDFVACFGAGTLIRGEHEEILVEELNPGDLVQTLDGHVRPVRLVLSRTLNAQDFRENPKLKPIRVTAGAMGQGLPVRDLVVSPQHRMLVTGSLCERMFGATEVLVSARKLSILPGIYVDENVKDVTYFHIVFDTHEVIFAEGAPSESFYFGDQAMAGLEDAARDELLQLFPELLQTSEVKPTSARIVPQDAAQRTLVKRLQKNALAALSE